LACNFFGVQVGEWVRRYNHFMQPLVVIDAVGLTSHLLPHAHRLQQLAKQGWVRPLREVLPAVTCTAQATMLTGQTPEHHGIVGNGWLFRDTGEVRFWQQSNRLIEAEPLYQTARARAKERGIPFRCAKLFWWFNQGASVDISVTPKPYYGADRGKAFGIQGTPADFSARLERDLGPFPFPAFWGPMAGLPSHGGQRRPGKRFFRAGGQNVPGTVPPGTFGS
jgi:predicted AlkP superfamily pyrophosphatase or phosphodiesterase